MSIADKHILEFINSPEFQIKFWNQVNRKEEGCWLWTGNIAEDGYGTWSPRFGISCFLAHRVAYTLFNKRLPLGIVRHNCDNRACCNPNHLLEGTRKDNVYDRVSRDRSKKRHNYTHCIRGHEFKEGSYHINPKGFKVCKICRRIKRIK